MELKLFFPSAAHGCTPHISSTTPHSPRDRWRGTTSGYSWLHVPPPPEPPCRSAICAVPVPPIDAPACNPVFGVASRPLICVSPRLPIACPFACRFPLLCLSCPLFASIYISSRSYLRTRCSSVCAFLRSSLHIASRPACTLIKSHLPCTSHPCNEGNAPPPSHYPYLCTPPCYPSSERCHRSAAMSYVPSLHQPYCGSQWWHRVP